MTTVRVTSSECPDDPTADHQISTDELFASVETDDVIGMVSRVSGLSVPDQGCLSYSIIWHRLSRPQGVNVIMAVLLYERVDEFLDERGVEEGTLVCDPSVEELYAHTLADVADARSLTYRREDSSRVLRRLTTLVGFVGVLVKLVPVLADWFVARALGLFRRREDNESSIAYVPSISRLGSTLPVAESFRESPTTVITDPASYYYTLRSSREQLRPYDPTTLHEYLSFSGFLGQFRDLGTIAREILTRGPFGVSLSAALRDEFDVRLDSTATALLRRTLSNFRLIRSLLMRRSIRDFLDSSDCEAVVHGTLDPVGRTITHEALERNRDVYHIPHSIATTYPPNPQPTVTQFVAGSMDVRYYQRVVPEDQQWEWVPLGRPYLADLSERYADNEHRAAPDDRIRVVVATVTAPRDVREEFIETVLDAMDADRFSVVIKPHPDESHDLYDRVKKAYAGVRVISGGLYEEILDADLTITLNSNVGLESMVIGTPAVCYNEWAPLVLEQSYAFSDDVPVFRSPSELESFTSKIDRDGLSSVSIRQERFVKENYRLDPAITEDIARYIETGGASKPTEGSS